MTYVQGFVTPAPLAKRQAYLDHAMQASPLLKEFGAIRHVEAWQEDVPTGKLNDFHGAVQRREDEAVVFSWLEYPDRAACGAATEKMMSDPRMAEFSELPFDAGRMIYGGFDVILDEGPRGQCGYVDGFLIAVPTPNRGRYLDMARDALRMFLDHGALRLVEAWGDDVPHGKATDFYRATHAEEGESIVFSWVEWLDTAARDSGMQGFRADDRAKTAPADMPFDGSRMIFGGFEIILDR